MKKKFRREHFFYVQIINVCVFAIDDLSTICARLLFNIARNFDQVNSKAYTLF